MSNRPTLYTLHARLVEKYVETGESVVQIGGRVGLTKHVARQLAGTGGVTCYEARAEKTEWVRKHLEYVAGEREIDFPVDGPGIGRVINIRVRDEDEKIDPGIVEYRNAVVSKTYYEYESFPAGGFELGPEVSVDELPQCDVLVISCDGAEVDVLDALPVAPDRIVVEHHAVLENDVRPVRETVEYDPVAVTDALKRHGYAIVESQSTKPGFARHGDIGTIFCARRRRDSDGEQADRN